MKTIEFVKEQIVTFGSRISKETAKYVPHSMSGEQCRNCVHFEGSNRCEIVLGSISPDGWCKYFQEE